MPSGIYKRTLKHNLNLKKNHKGFGGKKHTLAFKRKLSRARRGSKGTNWRGGLVK